LWDISLVGKIPNEKIILWDFNGTADRRENHYPSAWDFTI
jgi:hypothetical protein